MDINKTNILGMSTLHCACTTQHTSLDALKLLLEWGADVNACSGSGKTALHYACISLDLKKIKLLLAYDADVNIYEFHSCLPLMSVVKNPAFMNLRTWPDVVNVIIDLLLAAGTKLSVEGLEVMRSVVVDLENRHDLGDKGIQLIRNLYRHISEPLSLNSLCRIHIRNSIRPNIDDHVDKLPLPVPLLRYLKFSDIAKI